MLDSLTFNRYSLLPRSSYCQTLKRRSTNTRETVKCLNAGLMRDKSIRKYRMFERILKRRYHQDIVMNRDGRCFG